MKTNPWGFTQNPFLNSTDGSFKKMNILAADHLSRLKAEVNDPDIVPMVARTEPARADWLAAYGHWLAVKGTRQGETQRFTDKLDELSSNKIKEWDIRIQVLFPEGTPDYKAILPDRRKPFQSGVYEGRISELYALRERLGAYPMLVAVQGDVSAFYISLLNTRDVQQQKEGLVKQASDLLELERIKLAQVMYHNLAALMIKFREDTEQLERFFSLELLRSTGSGESGDEQKPGENMVAAGSIANVLSEGFTSASIITLENTGNAPLTFYLAASPDDAPAAGSTGIQLQPGDTISHSAIDFGPGFLPCLNVRNDSATAIGRWEVSVA